MSASLPVLRPDDLRAIVALQNADFDTAWSPWTYEVTLLMMNPPDLLPEGSGALLGTVTASWVETAAELGIPMSQLLDGYPSHRKLDDPARAKGLYGVRYQPPSEGWTAEGPRQALLDALEPWVGEAVAGVYDGRPPLGPDGDVLVEREVNGLRYAFIRAALSDILREWRQPAWDTTLGVSIPGLGHRSLTSLSFLWPEDRAWFFHHDPDAAFSTLSGSWLLAERLLSDSRVECWIGASDGPRGRHRLR